MGHIRAVTRIILILIVTSGLLGIWSLGRCVLFPSKRSVRILRYWIVQSWSRTLCWLMGIRVKVYGTTPNPPFCLVANHLSYVDVLLLHSTVKCKMVARDDIKKWPLIGFLADHFGTLYVDRTTSRDVVRAGNQIEEAIESGYGVTFFPEGTSSGGREVGPFKSSLLEYPAHSGLPVYFASIHYRTFEGDPPASRAVCWWGAMTFASHAYCLLGLRGFRAQIEYGATPVAASDRKQLASLLWGQVTSLFEPTEKISINEFDDGVSQL